MNNKTFFSFYEIDFHQAYKEFIDRSFDSLEELISFCLKDLFKKLSDENKLNEIQETEAFINNFSHHLKTVGWNVPLILHPSFDSTVVALAQDLLKDHSKLEKFREVFFNFICYTYFESEFSAKKLKPFILLYEQHQAHHEKTILNQQHVLKELDESPLDEKFKAIYRENIKTSIDKIKSDYSNLMPVQDSKGELIEPTQQIQTIKTLFPDLFSKGRPKQEAINYLIFNLYLLAVDNERKIYLPTVIKLLKRIQSFNLSYLHNLELNENAIRKKINDLKKVNFKTF